MKSECFQTVNLKVLLDKIKKSGLTVATAESLTGGLVAANLVSQPGSSDYFQGGIVAYSNSLKVSLLGVPQEVIDRYGAVSEECARAMARGVRQKLGVGMAVSTTGIAGPGGGTFNKPVGLVWVSVATEEGTRSRRCLFSGGRLQITESSVQVALELLSESLDFSGAEHVGEVLH